MNIMTPSDWRKHTQKEALYDVEKAFSLAPESPEEVRDLTGIFLNWVQMWESCFEIIGY